MRGKTLVECHPKPRRPLRRLRRHALCAGLPPAALARSPFREEFLANISAYPLAPRTATTVTRASLAGDECGATKVIENQRY